MSEPIPHGAVLQAPVVLPLRCEIIGDAAAFERLSAEWDLLLTSSPQQNFFLRFAWVRGWWRHYAPRGARLYVICCRDSNGCLVGIAPWYVRPHRWFGVPYLRELAFIGTGIDGDTSEFMDLIVHRHQETAVTRALVDFLTGRADWDRLYMNHVPSESRCLRNVLEAFGSRASEQPCDRAPYVDTAGTWDDYRKSLGRSMRRNVEYYARRLFNHRRCEFNRATTRSDAHVALDALVRLHQQRWQAAGHPGAFSDSSLHELLRETLDEQFEAGRVRLWTLCIEGQIEAALLGFLDNGTLHYFQMGFNPAHSRDDIGTALLGLCLRDSFEDPAIGAFDFMGGGDGYKQMWARSSRMTSTCVADRRNLRTWLHGARARLWQVSASVYRKLTPMSLRLARRDFIRGRMRQRVSAIRERTSQAVLALSCHASDVLETVNPFAHGAACLV